MVIFLAACQPAATAVPAPVVTEESASLETLSNGIWFDPRFSGLVLSINGDAGSGNLTYSVYMMAGLLRTSGGTAKFEDGKLSYLTDFANCGNAPEATYKMFISREDGFIASLREEVVGSDPCSERAEASQDIYIYLGPAARSSGDEQPPKTGGELLGLWYSKDGQLMIYTLAKLDLKAGITDININLYDTKQDPWLELGSATARYQDGKLTFLTNKGSCEGSPEVAYTINMVVYNGKMIGMRPALIGDDPCADRKETLDNQFIWNVDP
jgi:hypothetical protein